MSAVNGSSTVPAKSQHVPAEAPVRHARRETPLPPTPRRERERHVPWYLFAIVLACLVALLGLGVAYATSADVRAAFPAKLWGLPLAVPWFGAVGGALASLAAIGDHARHWVPGTEYRHIARPFSGAVMGTVGALILLLLADLAAGGTGAKLTVAAYDVIAFIAGYREETFRLLVKRGADALLVPGDKSKESSLQP